MVGGKAGFDYGFFERRGGGEKNCWWCLRVSMFLESMECRFGEEKLRIN